MNILTYHSYKNYLSDVIELNRDQRGFQTKLAHAAGCHGSYLSSVLSGKTQLTPDHAYGIKNFLNLSGTEFEYFFNLVLTERAATPALKKELLNQREKIKAEASNLRKKLDASSLPYEFEQKYYSAWYWGAIHMATYAEDYQTISSLAERFDLPQARIKQVLEELLSHGLVTKKGERWIYQESSLHIEKSSLMNLANHTNWRIQALKDIEKDSADSLHYSSAMVISKKDAEKINSMIVEFLQKQRKVIEASPCEEVYSFSCDFFKV